MWRQLSELHRLFHSSSIGMDKFCGKSKMFAWSSISFDWSSHSYCNDIYSSSIVTDTSQLIVLAFFLAARVTLLLFVDFCRDASLPGFNLLILQALIIVNGKGPLEEAVSYNLLWNLQPKKLEFTQARFCLVTFLKCLLEVFSITCYIFLRWDKLFSRGGRLWLSKQAEAINNMCGVWPACW